MKLNDYQAQAVSTAVYTFADYPFMALSEEAGEVMGKLAKFSRNHESTMHLSVLKAGFPSGESQEVELQLREDLKKELGDVLWNLATCANELNLSLESIAEANLDKLKDREKRGVLNGAGDDR